MAERARLGGSRIDSMNSAPATASTIERNSNEARLLETCCIQLERELGRQVQVLEACKEQGRAARARDIASLDQATRALAALMQEGIRAEGERLAVTARLAAVFSIAPAEFRLSALIARAPETWRARLMRSQSALKETLATTRRLLDANGRYLRDGARSADRILNEVFGAASRAAEYDAEGQRPGRGEGMPAVLNVAG